MPPQRSRNSKKISLGSFPASLNVLYAFFSWALSRSPSSTLPVSLKYCPTRLPHCSPRARKSLISLSRQLCSALLAAGKDSGWILGTGLAPLISPTTFAIASKDNLKARDSSASSVSPQRSPRCSSGNPSASDSSSIGPKVSTLTSWLLACSASVCSLAPAQRPARSLRTNDQTFILSCQTVRAP